MTGVYPVSVFSKRHTVTDAIFVDNHTVKSSRLNVKLFLKTVKKTALSFMELSKKMHPNYFSLGSSHNAFLRKLNSRLKIKYRDGDTMSHVWG